VFSLYANADDQTGMPIGDQYREELIVTATFASKPKRETGSAVSLLTADDIDARKSLFAADLLREMPGVAVSRGGGIGNLTQLRLRGAESNHTLVLIDDIEVNDPAFASEFNFADLMTHGVGRMEVLRGPQSALYGSDAIGGVVNVVSAVPEEPWQMNGIVEAGSRGSRAYGASIGARSDRGFALLNANKVATHGASISPLEDERDGFDNETVHAKLGWDLSDRLALQVVARESDGEVDTDAQDFAFPPTATQGLVVDADDHSENRMRYAMVALDGQTLGGRWLHTVRVGYTDTDTRNYMAQAFASAGKGRRTKYEYRTTVLVERQSVTFGVQQEELTFENIYPSIPGASFREKDEQTSVVAEYATDLGEQATVAVSARRDINDRFEDATTYRATGTYFIEGTGTRLHASIGEGITNPSFTELFGFTPSSFVGNPELEPESSLGWDIGLEQSLFDGRLLFDLTYFDADLTDEIVTVFDLATFAATAVNQRGESERRGLELSWMAEIGNRWSLMGAYTYLDATDPDGRDEVRRPRHSGSVNLSFRFADERGRFNIGVIRTGEREDAEFVFATPTDRATLDPYTLVSVAVSFALNETVEVFARGENLLDDDYVEVFGFASPARAAYAGIKVRL
jgi:vitamin B12 transporter